MPALIEPIGAPEPLTVELAHKDVALLDIGTVINGLTPALSISVEPSGIVPPFNVKFEFVVVDESGMAVPPDVALLADALVEAQAEVIVEPNPPPSKIEPATDVEAMPDPLDPIIPEDIPEDVDPPALQFEIGAGLRPPGSISVAPSGMPVPPFSPAATLAPSMPSGEVAPRPDVDIALCAWAAPQPNRIAATMRGKSRMERLRCWG
jgi:hypothetical protein